MKKYIIILLVLFAAYNSFAQKSTVQRATASNVVEDQNLRIGQNLYIPTFTDTATASVSLRSTQDTCGAIIYTYDVNKLWYRNCYPYKHWELVGTGAGTPILPDGVYSGGNVAWSGTGLIFNVSPASYVLNGIARTYNGGTVTLPPADPTFARIDVIVLDSTGASFIPGTPSATPQEPSINPQLQIRRAIVTIPANSLVPAITSNIIFDENLGQPSEWDATSTGTVVFGNTNFPYHLTVAAAATGFVNGQTITFSNDSSYNSSQQESMVWFIRLGGVLSLAQNININLLDSNNNVVGQTLNFTSYGGNRTLINSYQAIIIPMPDFGAANLVFNQIRFTASGAGTFPQFNADFGQFQNGFTQVFNQQNAFTSIVSNGGTVTANSPNSTVSFLFESPFTTTVVGSTINVNYNNGFILNEPLFSAPNIQPSATFAIDGKGYVGDEFRAGGGTFTQPNLWVNKTGDNIVHATVFASQNFSTQPNGASQIDGTLGGNAAKLQFVGGSYIWSYQQPFMILTAYPQASTIGLIIDNGTEQAVLSTYHITEFKKSGTLRSWIDIGGGMRSDSTAGYNSNINGLLTDNDFATKRYVDSLSGGGSFVTSIGFNTATGIRSTAEPLTSTGTIRIDTTVIATRLYVQSFGTFYNTNVGSSYRWAIPNTNTIKTLRVLNGILADSATSNTISIQVDSATYATKAFVASVAGGGGFTGVTTVSVVSANGFAGTVANPTTTPAITLTTTATGVLKGNGTAISAATSGTDFSAGTSGLATGILKSTTTTGALTIAVAGDFPTLNQNTTGTAATITGISTVAHGGTGLATLTPFALMAGGTLATNNMQQVSGVGTTGQVLTSNGAGTLPTWQAVSVSSGVSSLTGTANRVTVSASTGAITISGPQDIATTSSPTFRSLTLGGTAATTPLTFVTNTDATATAGKWFYNTTRLGFSLATTIQRVVLTTDAAPGNGALPIGNGTGFQNGFITSTANNFLVTNSAGGITVGANGTFQTLTSGATITWSAALGYNANLTLANTGATLNITAPVDGQEYTIVITQGTGGSRTITTWPAGTIWSGGGAPTLATAVGAVNVIVLKRRGTGYIGKADPNTYQ